MNDTERLALYKEAFTCIKRIHEILDEMTIKGELLEAQLRLKEWQMNDPKQITQMVEKYLERSEDS